MKMHCNYNSFSENYIKAIADYLVLEGYDGLGYEYIIIDSGWWETEQDWTTITVPNRKRFPSGMKSLVDYVSISFVCKNRYSIQEFFTGSFERTKVWSLRSKNSLYGRTYEIRGRYIRQLGFGLCKIQLWFRPS